MSASAVAWPGRGNRGKGSQERRATERLSKGKSMTQVAVDTGVYYDGYRVHVAYNRRTDRIETDYVQDRSLTKQQHLTLFDKRGSLLRKSNPFAMPDDFKRQTSRSKRTKADEDTQFRQPRQ